jgi:hypothetical protein
MFGHIVEAKHIQDYQVWIKFDDRKSGKINLIDEI